MEAKEIILASLNESKGYLYLALNDLPEDEITWTPASHCNSLAFILWHVTRVEDTIVNEFLKKDSAIYELEGWRERLGTPEDWGTEYTEEQLQSWPTPRLEALRGYARAVHRNTVAFLDSITPEELLEIPQPDSPGRTAGVLLAHLITEIAMHVGQIDYLRGVHRGLKPVNWP
ncbi:MAG: DinB family protein [Dehalococcoidales bacterium]|nr:MAG: DinB family protein [Dehalococcoidales bacterium]